MVCAEAGIDSNQVPNAAQLSAELGLVLLDDINQAAAGTVVLTVAARGLELRIAGDRGRPIQIDLTKLDTRSPAGRNRRQPLRRALGLRRRSGQGLKVIDATAGWGEDSWLIASAGCSVLAVERHGAVAALLRDALARASKVQQTVAGRIQVLAADARDVLHALSAPGSKHALAAAALDWINADVIYIDPMYPGRRKTAERKALRVLGELVGSDADADQLFAAAVGCGVPRVVVKRPLRAAPLAAGPHHSHDGKAVRYDVYLL
jgi:16S rRNA (guanine1516-N2)-methyltransferase